MIATWLWILMVLGAGIGGFGLAIFLLVYVIDRGAVHAILFRR